MRETVIKDVERTTPYMNTSKLTFEFTKYFHIQSASLFLMLLLCTDIAFISLHAVVALSPLFDNLLFSLEKDQGYPEMFQYIKWFWIIILFTYLSIIRRSLTFCAWAVFFTYLLFDDAVGIHERVGALIAGNLTMTPPFGLRLLDIGELVVTGVAGVILLSFVLVAYVFGSKAFKKISHDLLFLIFILAFFGVFVDMLHIAWKSITVLGVIEDGGEMFVASIMCWYVLLISVRDKNVTTYLLDFIFLVIRRCSSCREESEVSV